MKKICCFISVSMSCQACRRGLLCQNFACLLRQPDFYNAVRVVKQVLIPNQNFLFLFWQTQQSQGLSEQLQKVYSLFFSTCFTVCSFLTLCFFPHINGLCSFRNAKSLKRGFQKSREPCGSNYR